MIIKTSYPFMKPPPSARLIRGHRLAQGLVGCWLMSEGDGLQVFDLSGNGNDGTLQGTAPSWTAGKFGSAVLLPGTNEYILTTFNSHEVLAGGPFTLIILYKGSTDYCGLFAATALDGSPNRFHVRHENKIGDTVAVRVGLGDTQKITAARIIDTTIYQHLAISFDGTIASVYVNSVLKEALSFVGWSGNYNNNNMTIGTRGTIEFAGNIDFASIYNRGLSASEIAELYWRPFCMFERRARTALMSGYEVVAPPVGMAGAMTTNTGYWGW